MIPYLNRLLKPEAAHATIVENMLEKMVLKIIVDLTDSLQVSLKDFQRLQKGEVFITYEYKDHYISSNRSHFTEIVRD